MAIITFGKVLDELSASLVKESVGRTYAADAEEEAEWDGCFSVVWVTRCFEEVLMFVCGLCTEICLDVVVNEMNLDI